MTPEIFRLKGIGLLIEVGEDSSEDLEEASTDDTDKLNKHECSER